MEAGGGPPPSPLTGCYLLIVIAEPRSQEDKDIILQRLAKGLLSWDASDCLVDLEKELAIITEQALEGEESRYGERLIQFASENLVTEILIHPSVSTLIQCVRNLLSSFTRHRHIIHSGYTFAGNGSWIVQDGTFSYQDLAEAFQEVEVQRVLHAYDQGISMDVHCTTEGEWSRLPKETFSRCCKLRLNPNDVLTTGTPAISSFLAYLAPFLQPAELNSLLQSSDVVGNIRFSRPTLYVFPGGQGDAALFGINGFNMLVDGGFSRKACFWDFVRHLDRLDAVLLTRLNNSNVNGISAVLRRKKENALYPQVGHFFCNIPERKSIPSPDGDKDKDPLLVNLLEEGQEIVSNLRHLNLSPQLCYRDSEPINLYHKVGHGTLDMYVLSPAKESKEVREFLQKWNNNDQKLFSNPRSVKEFIVPIQNIISICALLVWQPASPDDTITRILFPGSAPQSKIFEGLDRLRQLDCIKHAVCTEKSLTPVSIIKTKQKESIIDKIIPSDKQIKLPDNRREKAKAVEHKLSESIDRNGVPNGVHPDQIISDKIVKKSDSTESERSTSKHMESKKNEEKLTESKEKSDKPKSKPKFESRAAKQRTESQQRKKPIEKKASPTTPKKSVEIKMNGDVKPKQVTTAAPPKSTKDANNRKVLESKKTAPKREPQKPAHERKETKVERKPISSRPKEPLKAIGSPIKRLMNGVHKPESISRRGGKLDKEGTTDSSTVSTPSADPENILKKDISKLTQEEIHQMKAQELAELKEEQEAVREIEAVFQKSEKTKEPTKEDLPDSRQVKDTSAEDKVEEQEEYLIVEKVEIERDSLDEQDTKEDEILKLARDSEESEKQRKPSQVEFETDVKIEEAKVEKTETVGESQHTRTTTTTSTVSHFKQEMKEESVKSPDEKLDSTDKKTEEKHIEDDVKEVQESQPEEKVSGTFESGATTTAPTLPEDERITLDEIKEDIGDPGVEEKHVKEETKEKDIPQIQLPPKTFEPVCKLPPVVGIRLEKHTHIRDIVKTPDEVADLPVHEEVDIENYQSYENKEGASEKSKDKEAPANEGATTEKESKDQHVAAGLKEAKVEHVPQIPDNEAIEKHVESTNIETTNVIIKEKELSKSPDEEKEKDEGEQKEIETVEVNIKISETAAVHHEICNRVNEEDQGADKASKDDTTAQQEVQGKPETEEVKSRKQSIDKDLDTLRKASIASTEGKPEEDKDINETAKEAEVEKPVSRKQSAVHDPDLSASKSRKSSTIETEKPQLEDTDEHISDKSKKLSLDGFTEKSTPDTEILKDYVIVDKTDFNLESLEPGKIEKTVTKTEIDETTQKSAKVADLSIELDKVLENLEAVEVSESTNLEAPFEKLEAKDKSSTKQEPTSDKPDGETLGHQRERRKSSLGIESVSIHASPERIIDSRRSSIATDKVTSRKSSLIDDFGRLSPTDMHRRVSSPRFDEESDYTKLEAVIEDVDNKGDEKCDSPTRIDQNKKVIMGDKIEVMITEKIEEEPNEEVVSILGKETIIIGHKVEEPEKAETVVIPDSPLVEDKLSSEFIEKMELGRKSPKEREQDVIKIVASVAEVLKSDAPLEEFKGKIPFVVPGFTSYTEELRETHITTVDSPTMEQLKDISSDEKIPEDVRAKSPLASFLDQEREYSSRHIESEKEATAAELEDAGVVHRMLVTTSSEDGGEEIEICPPGSIIFSKSSESSGRSTPEPQSQKLSQRSSLVDTTSESLPTVKQTKATTDAVSSAQERSDITTTITSTATTSGESLKEEIERVVAAVETPPKVVMDVIKETSTEIGKSDAIPKDDDLKLTETLIKRDISNDLTVSGSSDKRDSGKVSPELRDITPDPPRPSGLSTPETEQKDSGRTSPEVLSTSGKSSPDVDSYKKRSLEGVQQFVEEPVSKVSVGGLESTALDHLDVAAHSPEKKLSISDVEINLKDLDEKMVQRKPSLVDVEKQLESQIIPHESFEKELETTKTVTTKSETIPDMSIPKMTETAVNISDKGKPKSITDKFNDICSGVEEICEKKIISIGGKTDSLLGGIIKIKDDVVGKLQEQTETAAEDDKNKFGKMEVEIQESGDKVEKDLVDVKTDIKDSLENIVEKTITEVDGKKDSISTVEEFKTSEEDKMNQICEPVENKAAEAKDKVEEDVSKVEASISTAASTVAENIVEIRDELKVKAEKVGENIEKKLTGAKQAVEDAGSKIEDSLSAASATIKDKVIEIKDEIKEQTEKISEKVEEAKAVINNAAFNIEEKAGDIKDEVNEEAQEIDEAIKEKATEVKEEVNDAVLKVEGSLGLSAAAEDKVVETKEKTDKINEHAEEKVTEVKDAMSKVKDSLASAADTIEDNTTCLKEDVNEKTDDIGEHFEENFTNVRVELQEAAAKAEESLSSTASTVKETVTSVKESIVEKTSELKEQVQKSTSKLEESLSSIASTIEDKVTDVKDAAASKVQDAGSSVASFAVETVTDIKDKKEAVEKIRDQTEERATEVKDAVKDTVSKIESDLSSALSTLEDKVTETEDAVKERTGHTVEHFETNLTDVQKEVYEAISKVEDSVVDSTVKEKISEIKDVITEKAENAGEQIEEKAAEVGNEVEDICTKAEASLFSATSSVIDKVLDIEDGIKDKTDEIGEQIGKKLTQAKKDEEGIVEKDEDSVSSAVSTTGDKVSDIKYDFKQKNIGGHIDEKAEEMKVEVEELCTKVEASLTSASSTTKDKVIEFKDDIKGNINGISEKVGEKVAEAKDGIKDEVSEIDVPISSAVSSVKEKVSDVKDIVKETADSVDVKIEDKIAEVGGKVEEVCTEVNAPLSSAASSVKDHVADITKDIKETAETFGKVIEEKATEAKEDLKDAESKIEESFSSAASNVTDKVSEIKNDVKEKTEKIGDLIEDQSVEVKDKVEEIPFEAEVSLSSAASTVLDKVTDFKDDMKNMTTQTGKKIEENASEAKEGIKDTVASAKDSISSEAADVADKVSEIKDDATEKTEIKDGVEEICIKAEASLTSAVSTVKDKVADIKDDIEEKTNKIGEKIEEKASEAKEDVKDAVENVENTLSSVASTVEKNVLDIKNDVKEGTEKIGEYIDEKAGNVNEGVEEVCTKAEKFISSAASTIQDKASDVNKDIKEKTGGTVEQIRENVIEAKEGIKDATTKVEDSLSSAASTVKDKVSDIKYDVKDTTEKIGEYIEDKKAGVTEGVEEICIKTEGFLSEAASTVTQVNDRLEEKTDEIGEKIRDITTEAKESLKDGVSTIEDTLKTTKSTLEEKTSAVGESFKEKTDTIGEKIEREITETKEKVQDTTSKIEESVSTTASSIEGTVTGLKDAAMDKVSEYVEEKSSEVKQGVQEAVAEVKDSLSTIKGEIKDTAEETETEIVHGVQSKIQSASSLTEDTKEEVQETIKEIEEKKDSFLGGIANSFNDLRSRVFGSSEKFETTKPDESPAGPSSSQAKLKQSSDSFSGKSTPDIAEVEKLKEMQETLKYEQHIAGSSTPPTVPVSPSVVNSSQPPEIRKSVLETAVSSIKDNEIRSCTPASDDYEIAQSTHSDISSGQVSRTPYTLDSERVVSDNEDDLPGSPLSMTSQVAGSRSSSHYDLDDEHKLPPIDPMSMSFYGALPDDPEEQDFDFDKAVSEHREVRGADLVLKEGPKSQKDDVMTASFIGELPEATSSEKSKDPIESWGKPLGLPSPAPPSDNKGTPKKERKLPPNVSAKNKLNDDKKRSESPSKQRNKKVNPVYVDLTYVPHHGNSFYAYVDFFRRVRARYYVFSGIEPSKEVYNALLEAKQTWDDKDLEVTIIPTYDTDILGYWVAENEELLTKYKIDLSPSASRCTINLQDHETSCSAYRLEF